MLQLEEMTPMPSYVSAASAQVPVLLTILVCEMLLPWCLMKNRDTSPFCFKIIEKKSSSKSFHGKIFIFRLLGMHGSHFCKSVLESSKSHEVLDIIMEKQLHKDDRASWSMGVSAVNGNGRMILPLYIAF